MDTGLRNKSVVIAGSSRGIGLSIAEAFLQEGARVVITGRCEADLRQAKQRLSGKGETLAVRADMAEDKGIDLALKETLQAYGTVDIAVANIGSGAVPFGWDIDRDDWQDILEVNLLAGMALARAVLPLMQEAGQGNMVFTSSIAGWEIINAPLAYSVAKAALLAAMKDLSRRLGGAGIRVNAVVPGNIVFPGGTWDKKLKRDESGVREYIEKEVPLKRFGRPEEIADAVVFLASARASFVTGACLVVDGGQTRSI